MNNADEIRKIEEPMAIRTLPSFSEVTTRLNGGCFCGDGSSNIERKFEIQDVTKNTVFCTYFWFLLCSSDFKLFFKRL